ncbi:MAG: ATP-binding protein [Ardenticatenaceae bacterium]|nr:ATP-binding protein [Ardenticatenaceae bacterium]
MTRQVAKSLRAVLEQHTLELVCPNEPLLVEGDEVRLGQVLQNLLGNAVKYSPGGGRITVRLERRDQQVCLAVSDEGVGIPSEALPRLFAPFYRASNVAAHGITGSGLGLHVVKEIVTLHGGTIEVESTEGEGSTFTVSLPLLAQ